MPRGAGLRRGQTKPGTASIGVLAALTLAGSAMGFHQTLVLAALPTLQRSFHTTTTTVAWLSTGYLLAGVVATPIIGRLGDQYGKRRVLLIVLGVLLAGAVGAAAAPNIGVLLACRAATGIGIAVFPLCFAIVKEQLPESAAAAGIVSSVFVIGGSLGIVLSGVIIDLLSWRYIFVLGAVIVGAAVVAVYAAVPESPAKAPSRIDIGGALLLGVALACALLAVSEGNRAGWSSLPIVGLFAASVVAFAVWTLVELRVAEPLVDVRMLARRTVLLTNVCSLCAGWGMASTMVLLPLLAAAPRGYPPDVARSLGYGFGSSASEISLLILPGAAAGAFSGVIAARMSRRWGAKWALAFGVAFLVLGYVVAAGLHDRLWQILLISGCIGFGTPFHHLAATSLVIQSVRPTETGVATGLNSVIRTIGSALGTQIPASILASSTIAGTTAPTEGAFIASFAIAAAICSIGVLFAIVAAPRSRRATPAAAA